MKNKDKGATDRNGRFAKKSDQPVETVSEVDIYNYQGLWYEIASYPKWFEKGLVRVSAQYTLKKNYVEVLNCGYKGGVRKEVYGKAKVVKGSGNAKLNVSFFWPFSGKYWIIDLDTDYTWAVVSNPRRSSLWILSRSPVMDEKLYADICDRLESRGFDLSRLAMMPQE